MNTQGILHDPTPKRAIGASPFRGVLHIGDDQTDLAARGVQSVDPARAEHLRDVARGFVSGCNALFEATPFDRLDRLMGDASTDRHGFIAEGAAMGAVIRDGLSLRGGFLPRLVAQHSARFEYLLAVGAGWGIAKLPWRRRAALSVFDPVVRPLACDGHGFHDLYFGPKAASVGRIRKYSQGAAGSYDAGLGRAIWFVASGSPEEAVRLISGFDPVRWPDLIAGLGLAMGYAGPTIEADWRTIVTSFPVEQGHLMQGFAFAAEAHRRAGIEPATTTTGARALGFADACAAAKLADRLRPRGVANDRAASDAAYAGWRGALAIDIQSMTGGPA